MGRLASSDFLAMANEAFRIGDYATAVRGYRAFLISLQKKEDADATFSRSVAFNLKLAQSRLDRPLPNGFDGVFGQMLQSFYTVEGFSALHDRLMFQEFELASRLGWVDNWKTSPLVSVIMPVFNREALVLDSIATVLAQSYRYFELLVCDDGSDDGTLTVLESVSDPRVRVLTQSNLGAAAARNHALSVAKGKVFTYLDSDNYWHPDYLKAVVASLATSSTDCVYFDFVDYQVCLDESIRLLGDKRPMFDFEKLLVKPFIDLNTFAHHRVMYDLWGGFDSDLVRRQDYDLMLKYTWLRDPVYVPWCLGLYQRNQSLGQITYEKGDDFTPVSIVNKKVDGYFDSGLVKKNGFNESRFVKKVTVLVWDLCRNHFSKAFAVAEALSAEYQVELIAFDFFGEGVFAPLSNVSPPFETRYFNGSCFPDFFSEIDKALEAISGDMIYVVKPRMPSFGLAMIANARYGIPFSLEVNDLEAVVSNPNSHDTVKRKDLYQIAADDDDLKCPFSDSWSQLMEPFISQVPVLVTHNANLDHHYGDYALRMRNIKDETVYDPLMYCRESIRSELGFAQEDRVILFGGLLRKHKGIFQLVGLLNKLNDSRYKLLFVGSRQTPDERRFLEAHSDQVVHLGPRSRDQMAKINLAADVVVLWLDPSVSASHYQFPYKATDAFAMQTPVIANPVSDFADLARQGYLLSVPFEDWKGMCTTIESVFTHTTQTKKMVQAARRLFLRQFSYQAARSNFEHIRYALSQKKYARPYGVSLQFAEWFNQVFRPTAETKKKSNMSGASH